MISFIYFDLGGVVIKDFSATDKWEQFKKDFNISQDYWQENEAEMNRGHLPVDPKLVSAFANRFEKNITIWPVLEFARQHFKLGILTNMYPGLYEAIRDKGLLPNIEWDIIVNSSAEGFAKPDRRIFEIAQEKANVKNEEILFVENGLQNIDAAKDFGWQTFLYDSGNYEDSSQKLYRVLTSNSSFDSLQPAS